jgi:molybdenum cofactor guanylyltransferase
VAETCRAHITGLLLAGGRGERMGGLDKGLQPFRGQTLAAHSVARLAPQVGTILINANRHLDTYAALGHPVHADVWPDYAGPLAGFLTGMTHCPTPLLLTCPCDTPLFPLDLVEKLAQAMHAQDADIAMAAGLEDDGQLHAQPVFCLLKISLKASLEAFMASQRRKIDAWTGLHRCALVPFDRAQDAHAFANANTLAQLKSLESQALERNAST